MKQFTKRPSITRQEFEAEYGKLDHDDDGFIDMAEVKRYGLDEAALVEHLGIGIVWVGYSLNPNYQQHKSILKDLIKCPEAKVEAEVISSNPNEEDQLIPEDKSSFYPWTELTYKGEPICINEYATRIAKTSESAHVILIDDF